MQAPLALVARPHPGGKLRELLARDGGPADESLRSACRLRPRRNELLDCRLERPREVVRDLVNESDAQRRRRSEALSSTSAPAEKLGPSPLRTTARASPTSANASVSSAISAASNAFRRSGRASVIRSTGPSVSIRNASTAREIRFVACSEAPSLPPSRR
jgi:hypothetical protein